ncbi:MAG: terminase gpP N-terminus-related DNA-binding protein [Peptostreptococcaceae bacterium]
MTIDKLKKYEIAEKDYLAGMTYKDIAKKYEVAVATVKSWKTRYKWDSDSRCKGMHIDTEHIRFKETLERIKNDMFEQLIKNGNDNEDNREWVDTYVTLAETRRELLLDVKSRGVSVAWFNGKQHGFKKNESISEIPKIIKSMFEIRKSLGLQPNPNEDDLDYDDL